MTNAKKSNAKKSPAKGAKDATITIAQIALKAGRSPKVLRAIARNEAYRKEAGKSPRLPAPVAKHVYRLKDVPAFLKAIEQDA